MVEDAVQRLDPDEDTGIETDDFVTVAEASSALGSELRARISHALRDKSLEEMVETQRTDMTGLQVRFHVWVACFGRSQFDILLGTVPAPMKAWMRCNQGWGKV